MLFRSVADVSYSVPDNFGFMWPFFWNFQFWGEGGMITFSANSDGVELYKKGEKAVRKVFGVKTQRTYLQDMIDEMTGKAEENLLTSFECLQSAYETIMIQKECGRY